MGMPRPMPRTPSKAFFYDTITELAEAAGRPLDIPQRLTPPNMDQQMSRQRQPSKHTPEMETKAALPLPSTSPRLNGSLQCDAKPMFWYTESSATAHLRLDAFY